MTKEERIAESIARRPEAANHSIARNLWRHGVTAADVEAVRHAAAGGAAKASRKAPKGVALKDLRVLSRRPADSAARHIKMLPHGRGFSPKELSDLWVLSEDTIRRHAKDLGALRWVEIEEDRWEQMVMHPETAAEFNA